MPKSKSTKRRQTKVKNQRTWEGLLDASIKRGERMRLEEKALEKMRLEEKALAKLGGGDVIDIAEFKAAREKLKKEYTQQILGCDLDDATFTVAGESFIEDKKPDNDVLLKTNTGKVEKKKKTKPKLKNNPKEQKKLLQLVKTIENHQQKKKGQVMFDVWGEDDKVETVAQPAIYRPKYNVSRVKPNQILPMELPHSGNSYNPDMKSYTKLVNNLIFKSKKDLKKALKYTSNERVVKSAGVKVVVPASEAINYIGNKVYFNDKEDEDDADRAVFPSSKKKKSENNKQVKENEKSSNTTPKKSESNEKENEKHAHLNPKQYTVKNGLVFMNYKTRQQKNKEKKKKEFRRERMQQRKLMKFKRQINNFDKILDEVKQSEATSEKKQALRKIIKKHSKTTRSSVPKTEVYIQPLSEIPNSMRELRPHSSPLMSEYYNSILRRGLIKKNSQRRSEGRQKIKYVRTNSDIDFTREQEKRYHVSLLHRKQEVKNRSGNKKRKFK